jgi:protein TonB
MTGTRAFGAYVDEDGAARSWGASFAASGAIYLGMLALALVLGRATQKVIQEKALDITFVEKVVKAPPPPPPVVPQIPVAAAPVIRPEQKVRRLEKPPAPKELVAPKDMPKQAPAEADPSQDKGIAVYGDPSQGDPAGLEGGQAGGVAGGMVGGAIALPEDATPPAPLASNPKPPYPEEARQNGRTATVILKVVILADGTVAKVDVMRGEEPFASSAVAAVKGWKYEPARHHGQAITVYRIIQIPFKLTA